MDIHIHQSSCWARYEPCGEHHAHSYNCGGGELAPSCPHYERDLRGRISYLVRGTLSDLLRASELRRKLGKPTEFDELIQCAEKIRTR
jgi:hypothetical protein